MATLSELIVKIGADITDYEKKMKDTLRGFRKVGQGFSEIGKTLTVGVSLPLAGVGIAATKMAMEAVESENLFQVAMGNMADAARAWSEDLRKQLGLNSYELRRNVGVFYAMFSSMGLSQKSAYDLSTGLTQLAYDMASFYNLRPEEAFEKLRSGIVGEVEPLRALGIVVDDATVKAYAYRTGIAQQGQELTQQQKIMARYGVIMAQTSQAQGDLARTADSPTNRFRILSAQLQETAIKLGISLLPAVQALLSAAVPFVAWLGRTADGFNKLNPAIKNIILGVAGFAVAIGPILWGLGSMIGSIGKLIPIVTGLASAMKLATAAQWLLNVAMQMNPIGLIIAGIGALIAAVVLMWNKWGAFRDAIIRIWGEIKERAYNLVIAVLGYLEKLTSFIPGLSRQVGEFREKMEALRDAEVATQAARAATNATVEAYRQLAERAKDSTSGFGYSLGLTANSLEKVTEAGAGVGQAVGAAGASMQQAATITDLFTYKLDRLEKAWQLFTLTTKLSEGSREYLIKQQENLQARLQLVADQLKLTEAAYAKSVSQTGLWSSATMELGKALDDLRIKQAELQKQIDDTTAAMNKQSQFMVKEGKIFANTGQAWVEIGQQGMAGDPYSGRDKAEVDAIARRQGVDISTAASMYDADQEAIKQGKVPKYHTGGIFRAPPGRTEGLALLLDGERILPPGIRPTLPLKMELAGAGGGVAIHVNWSSLRKPSMAEMDAFADELVRLIRRKVGI